MSNPCNKQNNSDNHDRSAPTITKEELEKENAALKAEIAKLGNNLYTPSTVPSSSKEIMEVDREDRDQFSSSTPLKRSHTLELDPDEEAEIRRVSDQLVLDVDGAENKGVSFGVGVFLVLIQHYILSFHVIQKIIMIRHYLMICLTLLVIFDQSILYGL